MKLGSSSVKASALGEILFYVTALDYKDREYNDAEELLCAIIYEVLQQSRIFCLFDSILIDLFCCVKFGSITGNLRKKNHLRVAVFAMSQPTNLKSLLWDLCLCNLPTKSKPCCDDTAILQGHFILEPPQVFLISTVRSLDNLVVIKTHIVVP